jgi:hypothetical protein
MSRKTFVLLLLLQYLSGSAQVSPIISSWIINTTGLTGYDNLPANVQKVQYDANYVYVSCSCIPGYDIGPWNGNPNTPSNQNFVYKFPLSPQQQTGTLTTVGLGHTGVWTNGVSIFNANDAQTYNNDGVWYRNAYYFEGSSFDDCLGHPQQQGEYHHHVSPKCLYDQTDSTHHSPIIGYMFDGYPVYGAYGYANTDGTGGIKRMTPSYQLRNITSRTTDPYGNTASVAGPSIASVPLGYLLWDYAYMAGSGDLDSNNGRFCVTPEYPAGTYAYFVTIDSTLTPVYPYTTGLNYYGVVASGNTGMGGGHVTITDSTTVYTGDTTSTGIKNTSGEINFRIIPNPSTDYVHIYFEPVSANNVKGELYDAEGQLLRTYPYLQPSIAYSIDLSDYPAGTYMLRLESGNESTVQKIVKLNK